MSENIVSKNPATGEAVAEHVSFDTARLPETVAAARTAQKWWGTLSFAERSSYLRRAKDYMLAHMDEIARDISINNGKALVESLAEVMPMISTVSFACKKAPKILRDRHQWLGLSMPTKMAKIRYRPMGVLGIISPWNYPLSTPLAEVLLGLAAGNAVLLKPSEVTGLVNDQIQKIVDSMSLPENVFTMLHGRGDVGAALASSAVDRLILTGSVGTGKKVMEEASRNLVPVTLELGGKDSMIVLEDADLDFAASAALTGGFYNTGQACCSVERLLVHENVAARFTEALADKMRVLRQGRGEDFEVDIGPVTFEGQKKTYVAQTEDFAKFNAASFFGTPDYDGRQPFMKPLLIEAKDQMKFWTDETFGPVTAIKTFKTNAEAIEISNDTRFGLTAMVVGRDVRKAMDVGRRLNVGTVVINDAPFTNAIPQLPWGGVKDSGFGWVHGELGLKELSHAQVLVYDIFKPQKQFWWFPHGKAQYDFFKSFILLLEGRGLKAKWEALKSLLRSLKRMGPRL